MSTDETISLSAELATPSSPSRAEVEGSALFALDP